MRLVVIILAFFLISSCGSGANVSGEADLDSSDALYRWVDWKVIEDGQATGNAANIEVSFIGNFNINTTADDTAVNYFAKVPETFQHELIPVAPQTGDVIMTPGGEDAGRQVFTFSKPVTDPIIAILSLGSPTEPTRLVFENKVELLTTGPGHWGVAPEGQELRVVEDEYTVSGSEANGLIRILGTYSEIGFFTPDYESDFGYQIALK